MNTPDKAAILATWSITGILVTPLCGLWFSCGCDWPWATFFWACNAISKSTPLPHCPWCVHPLTAVLGIGGSLAAATLAVWKIRIPPWSRVAATPYRTGIGAAVLMGGLFLGGWVTALVTAYPTFLGIRLH